MVAAALADRVVEVITDLGGTADTRYRYGSGCIVRGGTVLTAAHVVTDAVSVVVRDRAKREYTATVDQRFMGDVDGPGPDLALLEIDDPTVDLSPMPLARVDRHSPTGDPVERCHAIGYPWFAETPSPTSVRDTADAVGQISVLSKLVKGLLSIQLSSHPRPLPPGQTALAESEWSGMSGAPVAADGFLLGVVSEHAPREGSSSITATPLSAIEADPANPRWGSGVADPAAWWERLGISGSSSLVLLPPRERGPRPVYWDTVLEIHGRTRSLVGRQRDLAAIADFATSSESYRWLIGKAWAGKTALLAEGAAAAVPAGTDVVCYFLSRREADADSNRFLVAVVPQLAALVAPGEVAPQADLYQFRSLWAAAAQRAGDNGRHLLLIVDGLDEDLRPPGSPSVAALLPARTGGHVHVLVTSRLHWEIPDDVPVGHPLRQAVPIQLQPFGGSKELALLAQQEIAKLVRRPDHFAVRLLGLLTAAAGPLSVNDMAVLSVELTDPSSARSEPTLDDVLDIDRFLAEEAARSLQPVGSAEDDEYRQYQFAHLSLLQYAQTDKGLGDRRFRDALHRWAARWRDAGWPLTAERDTSTPSYLLDQYPATLVGDPERLDLLVGDIGWVDSAIQVAGVDRVLATLTTARSTTTAGTPSAMLAIARGQAPYLRPPNPVGQPGYVLRQLCMQAAELGEDAVVTVATARLGTIDASGPVLVWTSRRASRALAVELGYHGHAVTAVAALPDGRIVSSGQDGLVRLWNPDAPGDEPITVADDCVVEVLGALPGGRIVGGEGRRIRIWDPDRLDEGSIELSSPSRVTALTVLADGRVVTGHADWRVRLWDPLVPGGHPVEFGGPGWSPDFPPFFAARGAMWVKHEVGGVLAVATLADGRVVSGDYDGWRLLWDPSIPEAEPVEFGHQTDGEVLAVAGSPDGRLISGDELGQVLAWDLSAEASGPVSRGWHQGVTAVASLPDGRIVSSGDDGRVLMWDLTAPEPRPVELGTHDAPVRTLAALPDGRVVTGGDDNRVRIWDPRVAVDVRADFGGYTNRVLALAVLPDGQIVSGGDDRRVLEWVPTAPQFEPFKIGGHDDWVRAIAVLSDGRVVTGGDDGRMLVWDLHVPGGAPVQLGDPAEPVGAVAVLPDGRIVTGDETGRLLLRDPNAPAGQPVRLGGCTGPVRALAVLADGRVVTGGDDGRVLVWDLHTPGGEPVQLGDPAEPVGAVAVLPDGRIVTGDETGRLLLRDPNAPAGQPVRLGGCTGPVRALAILPDSHVTSGDDRHLLVWDPTMPGSEPVQLGAPTGRLRAMAVLPDGRIATGGDDRRIRIWNAATPGLEPVNLGRPDRVLSVQQLRDGRIVTGGAEGRVQVWNPAAPGQGPVEVGASGALTEHERGVQMVAVLPDGRIAGGCKDTRILMWDPSRLGAEPVVFDSSLGYISPSDDTPDRGLVALPDGRMISVDRTGQALLWDSATPQDPPVELLGQDNHALSIAVLPDGRVAIGTGDGRVLAWTPDALDAAPAELLIHSTQVTAVAAFPDGKVVTGDDDGRVFIHDPTAPSREPIELSGYTAPVMAAAVTQDGRLVTTDDERILVQDPADGQTAAQISVRVQALAVETGPAGDTLIAVAHPGTGLSQWALPASPNG